MDLDLGGFRLRPYRASDETSLATNANDDRIERWTSDRFPHPYTVEHARTFIASVASSPQWAIDVGGDVVGGIGLYPKTEIYRRSADLGYWLAPALWGRGIASSAVRVVTEHAFTALDLVRVQALVFDGNGGSIRVLEKNGYVLEGRHRLAAMKRGLLHDELVFARLREP